MNIEIIAIDDGFFPTQYKGRKGKTLLLGIKTINIYHIVDLAYTSILVDGLETTNKTCRLIKLLGEANIVFLDGITYAGFDVVDADQVYLETGIPVIVYQQYPLDLDRVRKALQKHFPDWKQRYNVIEKIYRKMSYYPTRWRPILFYNVGVNREDAIYYLEKTMIYSPIPEPLRLADQIASTISRLCIINNKLL